MIVIASDTAAWIRWPCGASLAVYPHGAYLDWGRWSRLVRVGRA